MLLFCQVVPSLLAALVDKLLIFRYFGTSCVLHSFTFCLIKFVATSNSFTDSFLCNPKETVWNEEIRKKPRIFMHVPHQHCCVRMHVQSWSLFNARLFRRTQLNSIDFQNRYFLKYTVATRYSQYISKCNIYIQMEIVSAWNWLPKSWTTAVILDNVDSYQPKAWCINIWRETECCQCPPSLPLSHTKSFGKSECSPIQYSEM